MSGLDEVALAERVLPEPVVSVDAAPFWEAATDGRFLIKRCTACGEAHWYPRALCPFCLSAATVWEESPGEGVIYSFSVMRKSADGPYAVVYVTLDEGPSVLSHVVGCRGDELAIGARVKVRFVETAGGMKAPVFELVR